MATGNMAECFGTVIFEGVRAIGVLSYRTIKRHFGEHPVENLLRFFANKKMRIEKNGQVVESPRIGKVTKTLYGYHIKKRKRVFTSVNAGGILLAGGEKACIKLT